jgi:hypothetical protein
MIAGMLVCGAAPARLDEKRCNSMDNILDSLKGSVLCNKNVSNGDMRRRWMVGGRVKW